MMVSSVSKKTTLSLLVILFSLLSVSQQQDPSNETGGIFEKQIHAFNRAGQSSKDRLKETFLPVESIATPVHDKELIIAVPVASTFKELVSVELNPVSKEKKFTGYCIDVFKFAMMGLSDEERVNYRFVPFVEPEGDSSGSYNELLSNISHQVYDGAVADITILANRSQWADFTVTYTDLGVGKVARIDNTEMWIFFKPFGVYVWLAIVASFFVVGLVVWLFEHSSNQVFRGPLAHQIATVFWFTCMTIFFTQREKLTNNWAKFIVTVWSFLVLILIACYTAILSSLLTVQQIQIASKGNIIGYKSGSFVQGVIGDNMNFEDYRLQPYKTPKEYADALSKGSKHGGVDFIVDEIPYLKIFLAQYSDGYAMVSSEPFTGGFGFVSLLCAQLKFFMDVGASAVGLAFQKGSPLVHVISREIANLREDGTLKVLEKKWFKSSSSSSLLEDANNPKILTMGDLSGLFIIGATAFGLSLLTYLYNVFSERFHLKEQMFMVFSGGRLAIKTIYLYLRNHIIH